MKSFLSKTKIIFFPLLVLLLSFSFVTKKTHASQNPNVATVSVSPTSYKITISFAQAIPQGNIVDFELYNQSHQKIWQAFTSSGGTIFSQTTPSLPIGTYGLSIGLFTPNWNYNYAWFDNINQISVGLPTPTPTPVINSQAISNALNAYYGWKAIYVVQYDATHARVVRPENNNDTVSEGIGYGMLLSEFANDQQTFQSLWNYAKQYLDSNGLMNWNINAAGNIIGSGAATDADEDMAYALYLASNKWKGFGYDSAAKNLINAILQTEVSQANYIKPGDSWGNTNIMNPSYLAPSYYAFFAKFTGNSRWDTIYNLNLQWLAQAANYSTGLVPDWLNSDYSWANVPWDSYPNGFYYDGLRNPIRLLISYRTMGDSVSQALLQKQLNFFTQVGVNNLKSGYTLNGQPLTNYLDTAFLASYAAAGQVNPQSSFSQQILQKLLTTPPSGYFGTSLRSLVLFISAGAN